MMRHRLRYGPLVFRDPLLFCGTLYALLERFEKDGLITRTRTEESRKYYCLTAEGKRVLRTEYDRIRRQAHDMERALSGEGQGGTL